MRINPTFFFRLLFCVLLLLTKARNAFSDDCSIDFKYAPPWWQTAICLPDDWQKTLVGKDGSLLYDYPGKFSGFSLKIKSDSSVSCRWIGQKLVSPRIPIVKTLHRSAELEIEETTFAVAPMIPDKTVKRTQSLERIGAQNVLMNWAKPSQQYDSIFRHIAVGWNEGVRYRFKCLPQKTYTVVFGLCEGWHTNAGQRILNLKIESKVKKTVDIVAEKGINTPAVYFLSATDEDKDGWIYISSEAAESSKDKNSILNAIWVFEENNTPSEAEILEGRSKIKPIAYASCGENPYPGKPTRHDITIVRYKNIGTNSLQFTPRILVDQDFQIKNIEQDKKTLFIRPGSWLFLSSSYSRVTFKDGRAVVEFSPINLNPSKETEIAFCVSRGAGNSNILRDISTAKKLLNSSIRYWEKLDLPYDRITVPDPGAQSLIDSAIRNIYQAREIKSDLPAFQVGPTCYRGLWVVDGSFIMEAIAFLNRVDEARNGIKYLMSFQRNDGGFMLIDGHWKETGIVLWAISRHAFLTGDKKWLLSNWDRVEKAVSFIMQMRQMPPRDAPNAGLIPDGFSDGGLADKVPEYTNIYWTLAGWKAVISAAKWLGKFEQAQQWERQYQSFYNTFRKAAQRDLRVDSYGNQYLPIRMKSSENIPPQKAQWAFLHAVFPGKVFAANDPLVMGNMSMLRSVESQGLVYDTGWLKNGIWTYFGSFYAHAYLWIGQGAKAAETLIAFANHSSPLLCWREEQMPVSKGDAVVGDMPHNWASAEFIRLIRNCIVLERDDELHLLKGYPRCWAKPGAKTKLNNILTEFGLITFEFNISENGNYCEVYLNPPQRIYPSKIILHLEQWLSESGKIELPVNKSTRLKINLKK